MSPSLLSLPLLPVLKLLAIKHTQPGAHRSAPHRTPPNHQLQRNRTSTHNSNSGCAPSFIITTGRACAEQQCPGHPRRQPGLLQLPGGAPEVSGTVHQSAHLQSAGTHVGWLRSKEVNGHLSWQANVPPRSAMHTRAHASCSATPFYIAYSHTAYLHASCSVTPSLMHEHAHMHTHMPVRMLHTWLSPPPCVQAFRISIHI